MRFEVNILGAQAALPTTNRAATAQLLNHNDKYYLIDCAEGTQRQLRMQKLKFQRIEYIFISHLHGDHFLGLPGLLSSFQLLGRQKKLSIYAPKDFIKFYESYRAVTNLELNFEVDIIPLENRKEKVLLVDEKWLSIYAFPLKHRIDCWGFHFQEKNKHRKVRPEMMRLHFIPKYYGKKLQMGEDYINPDSGATIPNENLTDEPEPAYSYTFMTDTRFLENITDFIQHTDVLYHEATFAEALNKRAEETYHSTAREAALIAKKIDAQKLILGHFSARYKNTELLSNEAADIFSAVSCAQDGEKVLVP